jgi:hypothetical protein
MFPIISPANLLALCPAPVPSVPCDVALEPPSMVVPAPMQHIRYSRPADKVLACIENAHLLSLALPNQAAGRDTLPHGKSAQTGGFASFSMSAASPSPLPLGVEPRIRSPGTCCDRKRKSSPDVNTLCTYIRDKASASHSIQTQLVSFPMLLLFRSSSRLAPLRLSSP